MLQIPTTNHFNGRFGYVPRWIIIHGTAGLETAEEVGYYFQRANVSAHYVVGRDGTVVQCVNEEDAAWANGPVTGIPGTSGDGIHRDSWWSTDEAKNPNFMTISIEHVKPSLDNSDELTPAQKAASFALVADICKRWNIPMRYANSTGGITGHYSMDPVNKTRCPNNYPWGELWAYLERKQQMIPEGWSDDGTALLARNGEKVYHGFRLYILNNDWNAEDLPLESEKALDPLEISNPALGKGSRQICRFTILEWTPERGVFVGWGGQEMLALQAQLSASQATQQALTKQLTPLQAELKAAQAQLAELTTKDTQAQDDLSAAQAEITTLKQENAQLQQADNTQALLQAIQQINAIVKPYIIP